MLQALRVLVAASSATRIIHVEKSSSILKISLALNNERVYTTSLENLQLKYDLFFFFGVCR